MLALVNAHTSLRSSTIHEELGKRGDTAALVTVKRVLSKLKAQGLLMSVGAGASTAYTVTTRGRLYLSVNAHDYIAIDPDKRPAQTRFNFELFAQMPSQLLTDKERVLLEELTREYRKRGRSLSTVLEHKELERLVIELSWKSSRIEGNTYTLLDTEKLIREKIEAPGHDPAEAIMILNHKEAFNFVWTHAKDFKTVSRANLDMLHSILVKDLHVATGLRRGVVGVTGSLYRPLENTHQVHDAVESLCDALSTMQTPYDKALLALLGISYVQPFEDGNKRTSRLLANALLLAHGCAPLSYRSVEENEYREAMLVFYEINSIVPFKKIFIEQYSFAAQNYALRV